MSGGELLGGPLAVLVGPTAVGKTALAIGLAERLGGEVVTADSMQVYRGMDIGTAKPTLSERRGIPHHALDIVDPGEPFSVIDFRRVADTCIADILSRGRLPILAGGTGLYVRAVTEAFTFAQDGSDPALRERYERLAAREGPAGLHARLALVDPESAARLHPNDVRRVIRALEVFERSGKPLSAHGSGSDTGPFAALRPPRYRAAFVGLIRPRSELYARINARAVEQIRRGFVREVRRLLWGGLDITSPPAQGLGYREIIAYVRGACDLDHTLRRIQTRTRHYAKRQLTWFRRDPRIVWFDASSAGWTEMLERIARHLERSLGL
ncbi:MAG TPA: tRNA (adenosine(37)-N6)-dimethylallyltransferase MiaA [Limnochordia bacterium]